MYTKAKLLFNIKKSLLVTVSLSNTKFNGFISPMNLVSTS